MFTGLVRCVAPVMEAAPFGGGKRFRIDISGLGRRAEVGQSIAVNGACLTISALSGTVAVFEAVTETVSRTNLGSLKTGSRVNLEPALKAGEALDGHMVLGHVDALAPVLAVDRDAADNRKLTIGLPANIRHLVADKGSVAVDGISLTVAEAGDDSFRVAVIPHTWDNTTLADLAVGGRVNLEADVLARYAARIMRFGTQASAGVTIDLLRENGFL